MRGMRARVVALVLITATGALLLYLAWAFRHYDFTSALFLNLGAGVVVFGPLYFLQRSILERQERTEEKVSRLTDNLSAASEEAHEADQRLAELASRIEGLTEPERVAEAYRRKRADAAERAHALIEPGVR